MRTSRRLAIERGLRANPNPVVEPAAEPYRPGVRFGIRIGSESLLLGGLHLFRRPNAQGRAMLRVGDPDSPDFGRIVEVGSEGGEFVWPKFVEPPVLAGQGCGRCRGTRWEPGPAPPDVEREFRALGQEPPSYVRPCGHCAPEPVEARRAVEGTLDRRRRIVEIDGAAEPGPGDPFEGTNGKPFEVVRRIGPGVKGEHRVEFRARR